METQGSNFAGKVREYWLHPRMKIMLKTFLKIDVRRTQTLSLIFLTLILIFLFYFWGTHINSVMKLLHIRNYLQYFIRNESYNTMSLKF